MNKLTLFFLVLLSVAVSGLEDVQAQELVMYGSLGGASAGADDGGAIVTIDQTTGAATVLGTPLPGWGITSISFNSSRQLFGVTNNQLGNTRLIEIDPNDGSMIRNIGDVLYNGTPIVVVDIAFQPGTNVLYGFSGDIGGLAQTDLITINTETGNVTLIGNIGNEDGGYLSLGFASDGTLYAMPTHSANLYTLNSANANILTTTTVTPDYGALGLDVRPSDGLLFYSECCETGLGNNIYSLNEATGIATLLGSAGGTRRVHDIAFEPEQLTPDTTSVPTMSEWGMIIFMVLAGVASIYYLRRRRIKS